MTPENKIKFKANAQARSLVLLPKKEAEKRIETNYYVEGYAARYEPYVLYYDGDEPIYERFERGCFDNCDMSDVIMQFDHAGRVFARNTNGSLIVEPDDVSALQIEPGKDLCTLVTCTPYGINSHRLLVRGHRVENQSEAIRVTSDAIQIEPLLVAPAVALPILLILLIVLLASGGKKKPKGGKGNANA